MNRLWKFKTINLRRDAELYKPIVVDEKLFIFNATQMGLENQGVLLPVCVP